MNITRARVLFLAFGVALVAALLGGGRLIYSPSDPSVEQASRKAGDDASGRSVLHVHADRRSASTRVEPTQQVERFYASLDELDQRIKASAFDIEQTSRQLNGDPGRISDFVAKEIRYEHYNGVLRGALGTLISRAGNTCDQSLLIQALLKAAGRAARIRVGVADSTLNATLARRALLSANARDDVPVRLGGAVRADVDALFHTLIKQAPGIAENIVSRVARRPLGRAYCWVETEADGRTLDIDPLSGSPRLERAATTAFTTVPDSLRHRVTLEVTLSSSDGDRPLLSQTFSVDEIGLEQVSLAIVPARDDLLKKLIAGADVWRTLSDIDVFFPLLRVGNRAYVDRAFDLAGRVGDPGRPGGGVEELGKSLERILGGRGLGPPRSADTPAIAPPALVNPYLKLSVRYRIDAPDGAVESFSRTLFDRRHFPASVKREHLALALLQDRQILLPTFPAPEDYIAHRLIAFYRAHRPFLDDLARAKNAPEQFEAKEIRSFPLQLVTLAHAQDLAATALVRSHGGTLFRGRPGILTLNRHFDVRGMGIRQVVTVDIVSTGFEAVPAAGRGKILRAKLGLYSSILEGVILGDRVFMSASLLRSTASEHRIPLITIETADDPTMRLLEITQRQRTELVQEVNAGHLVVAFGRPVPLPAGPSYGWWRVDRGTGEILGVLENGEGGAMQEGISFQATVTTGAVTGALGSYLICWWQEGVSAGNCVWAAACGAAVGGVFAGLTYGAIGAYGAVRTLGGALEILGTSSGTVGSTAGGVIGGVGSVVLDQVINFCQDRPPINDPNDNDLDGRPNNEDPNDDCPRCDDRNPPQNDRNDDTDPDDDNDGVRDEDDAFPSNSSEQRDADGDGVGGNRDRNDNFPDSDEDGVRNDEDAFPSDPDEQRDTDKDGVGDNHERRHGETDSDGDGVRDSFDAFPRDRTEHWDSDGDGVGDNADVGPKDPRVTRDQDQDGIDDQFDLDPSRIGPWIKPADDSADETPQPEWNRPYWARTPEQGS